MVPGQLMPFHQIDNLRIFTFESLDDAGVTHAVFTRQGGVSPSPWDSLNFGGTVGDDPARVAVNRQAAFSCLSRDVNTLFDVWQVHSSDVVVTSQPRDQHSPHLRADAILTDRPNVSLLMRFADCVPIFMFDPILEIAGIVHSGWPGTVSKILRKAVDTFTSHFHTNPENLLTAIGPSICVHHYEIGMDVETQVRSSFHDHANDLLPVINGHIHFDLWKANQIILEECGVKHIEIAQICTACHPEDWYSHRGENGKTGRFGAVICL